MLIMLFGGVAGPVLLLVGLERVTAVSGSLLLNLEAPFTALLAVVAFREHLSARGWLAGGVIVLGAAVLGGGGAVGGDVWGVVLIAGACAAWAIDNNLTQRLTLRDPFAIVRFKAYGATAINLLIALLLRRAGWPDVGIVAAALALGAVSYGASILLDAYALRLVGAAREAALFATAPFAGALVAIAVLGDRVTATTALAGGFMVAGTVGFLTDHHEHEHAHEALMHEHRHTHDEHHDHDHPPGAPTDEPVGAGNAFGCAVGGVGVRFGRVRRGSERVEVGVLMVGLAVVGRSGCLSVLVDESVAVGVPSDRSAGPILDDLAVVWCALPESTVWSTCVVMRDIFREELFEVWSVPHEGPVEEFAAHRADPAFRVRVRDRCARWRGDDRRAGAAEHFIEPGNELSAAVAD